MMPRILLFISLLFYGANAISQLSGNNHMEFQLGNLPGSDPRDLTTHYNQLNLQYRYRSLTAGIRYEHFYSQNTASSYNRLTQYNVTYRNKGLEIEVGNFIGILGNGLLLRAYEIPGSVFEAQSYRSRYGFYRDLRGVSVKYNGKVGYAKALRGKTLANVFPPLIEESDRRPDLTEGIETGLNFFGQTAGLVFMRNTNITDQEQFYSLLFSGNLSAFVSYNFEFAHNIENQTPLFALSEDARYGIYSSLNFSLGTFGLSLEYKDYHDLLIGSGISDPPTLVKEHKYKLLNRSIHVPQYVDESGTQVEAYYSFPRGTRLLLNYTRAVNEFASSYVFREFFAEIGFDAGSRNTVTLFADYSEEPIRLEDHRYTGGMIWELELSGGHSTLLEFEYQAIERSLLGGQVYQNMVVVAGWSKSPKTSVSLTWEYSTDINVTGGDPQRNWFGVDVSHKIDQRNTVTLFAGQRRGGPACTSGICYEVLDFEGVEVRLKTRF